MKKGYLYILLSIVLLWSCDNQWDSHYSQGDQTVEGGHVSIINSDMLSYLKSIPEYSLQYSLFEKTGVIDRINSKNQGFTILVYPDSVMQQVTDIDSTYFARTCVCDLAYLPTHLKSGASMLMWNGKYLKVKVADSDILFNDVKVNQVIKANNGYIYIMDTPIYAPKSLYELLSTLKEDYSIFKEMILGQDTAIFDEANSTPIGVDKTGNTIYDSVFITSNPLFDKLNISNEYINGTIFIPSNEIIKESVDKACNSQYAQLGTKATSYDSLKYKNWIWQAMFYDKRLSPEDYQASLDRKSVYSKVWRNTVQGVDLSQPINCSNGVAYYVTKMRLPNNLIINRIKHYFKYWRYCTTEEKNEYFKWTNIDMSTVEVKENFNGAGTWSPDPKNWPYISNDFLCANAMDATQPITLEFTALNLKEGDGTKQVTKALIPPGEYTFAMGFDDGNKKQAYTVNISIIDATGHTIFQKELKLDKGVNCDRTGGGYPDGYSPSGLSKGDNYDRDGATVGTVIFDGNELQPMTIRIETVGVLGRLLAAHHWCLRPTANNY